MKRAVVFLVIACFMAGMVMVSAADAVDIYTFKKDRVDQELDSGNRGYLMGKPKNIPEDKRNLKRTLIGIDVELAAGPELDDPEPEKLEPAKKAVKEKQPPKSSAPVTVVGSEDEEEWIK